MGEVKISQIRKRDGSLARFDPAKIEQAIYKALAATKAGNRELAASLTREVVGIVERKFARRTPGVEDVQDIVEQVLMTPGLSGGGQGLYSLSATAG